MKIVGIEVKFEYGLYVTQRKFTAIIELIMAKKSEDIYSASTIIKQCNIKQKEIILFNAGKYIAK